MRSPNNKQAQKSVFLGSMIGLANTVAAVSTFFGTPLLYSHTVDWVRDFTHLHYGYGHDPLMEFCWFVACGRTVFFVARASVSTALVFGGVSIAARFL